VADNLRDNNDQEDKERGYSKEAGDDTEIVLEVEQQGHKNTFIRTPLQYIREMHTNFSMITETKILQHESCVKSCAETTC
jgi:hypothetical protein